MQNQFPTVAEAERILGNNFVVKSELSFNNFGLEPKDLIIPYSHVDLENAANANEQGIGMYASAAWKLVPILPLSPQNLEERCVGKLRMSVSVNTLPGLRKTLRWYDYPHPAYYLINTQMFSEKEGWIKNHLSTMRSYMLDIVPFPILMQTLILFYLLTKPLSKVYSWTSIELSYNRDSRRPNFFSRERVFVHGLDNGRLSIGCQSDYPDKHSYDGNNNMFLYKPPSLLSLRVGNDIFL